jgi:prevent-host-death family protein
MAKRIVKKPTKSTLSKTKAAQLAPPGTRYRPDTAAPQHAVRESSSVQYGRTTAVDEPTPSTDRREVPATQAKNRFGEILQTARDSGPVFIERHGQAQAVVLGIDTYNKLISNERTSQERELDYWTREFHALHATMQMQEARQAVDALFSAADAELNRRGI